MLISFFEEFPTAKNITKLKLITFPTKLYLAANSLSEFQQITQKIKSTIRTKHLKEFVYWPILTNKEGYWLSPFSRRTALKRIFNELNNASPKNLHIPILLDLELPTTRNPWLYLTQALNFFRNKRLIQKFINHYSGEIYLAEYYPQGKLKEKMMQFFGLHYSCKTNHKPNIIKMVYHSLHRFNKQFITKELSRGKQEYGDKYLISYGTIAAGIHKTEPILSLQQLKEDLTLAKRLKITEVVIYRLGGLDKKFVDVIKKVVH